jgi:hypothetical protein
MTNKTTRAIPPFLQAAKPAVVHVGDGRGFIVSTGESRYVITAAHCLPRRPPPHLANGVPELTYPNILGPLATDERTIWAELDADNLVDDFAVFREPDGQELYEECERYEKFTAAAMVAGHPPVALAPHVGQF